MNNKFKNILLMCILMLLAGFEFVHSQVYSQMKAGPQVYYRFFKYPLTEDFTKTGLRMFIQTPYNELLFIKEEDFFDTGRFQRHTDYTDYFFFFSPLSVPCSFLPMSYQPSANSKRSLSP